MASINLGNVGLLLSGERGRHKKRKKGSSGEKRNLRPRGFLFQGRRNTDERGEGPDSARGELLMTAEGSTSTKKERPTFQAGHVHRSWELLGGRSPENHDPDPPPSKRGPCPSERTGWANRIFGSVRKTPIFYTRKGKEKDRTMGGRFSTFPC